ncbi:MAG: hypothetical protein QW429_04130 [Thermoprotei archaeon]
MTHHSSLWETPPEIGDLLIFGFAYLLLYYKFENSVGILLAYIVTGEWVALAIPASLGETTFDVFLYARIAVSASSLALLAFRISKPNNTRATS